MYRTMWKTAMIISNQISRNVYTVDVILKQPGISSKPFFQVFPVPKTCLFLSISNN